MTEYMIETQRRNANGYKKGFVKDGITRQRCIFTDRAKAEKCAESMTALHNTSLQTAVYKVVEVSK